MTHTNVKSSKYILRILSLNGRLFFFFLQNLRGDKTCFQMHYIGVLCVQKYYIISQIYSNRCWCCICALKDITTIHNNIIKETLCVFDKYQPIHFFLFWFLIGEEYIFIFLKQVWLLFLYFIAEIDSSFLRICMETESFCFLNIFAISPMISDRHSSFSNTPRKAKAAETLNFFLKQGIFSKLRNVKTNEF